MAIYAIDSAAQVMLDQQPRLRRVFENRPALEDVVNIGAQSDAARDGGTEEDRSFKQRTPPAVGGGSEEPDAGIEGTGRLINITG